MVGQGRKDEMKTEKERRIYYQDIVYHVCYALDLIDEKQPGHGIVCGTADEPNTDVFDRMKVLVQEVHDLRKANAERQGRREATYSERSCSPLPPCVLCGRTEYPVEYGPRQNKLPAGSLVGFDNGQQAWICRRCSRDPAALERLENDPSIVTANQLNMHDPATHINASAGLDGREWSEAE